MPQHNVLEASPTGRYHDSLRWERSGRPGSAHRTEREATAPPAHPLPQIERASYGRGGGPARTSMYAGFLGDRQHDGYAGVAGRLHDDLPSDVFAPLQPSCVGHRAPGHRERMVPQGRVTEAVLGRLAESQLEGEGGAPVVGCRGPRRTGRPAPSGSVYLPCYPAPAALAGPLDPALLAGSP